MTSSRKSTLLPHCIAIFAGALVCLAWLLLLPGDADNAFFLGLSSRRLVLAIFFLLGMLGSAALAVWDYASPGQCATRLDAFLTTRPLIWKLLFSLSIAGLLAGLALVCLPPDRLGDDQYAFARLKPVLAWCTWLCLLIALFFGHVRYRPDRAAYAWADFRASLDMLRGSRRYVPGLLAGGLAGGILALAFRSVGSEIFGFRGWLPAAILALGICLLLAGLLYNRSLVATIPYGVAGLLLLGCLLNLWVGRADATRFNARIQSVPGNDAAALGQTYHYSWSVYHILSKYYPGSRLIVAPGLLQEWNLTKDRLISWVPFTMIQEIDYDPALSQAEASQILALDPLPVEINTTAGTRTCYFLPDDPLDPSPILLLYQDHRRFFLPQNTFSRLFPERGPQP